MRKTRIAVLCSGGGTNFQAIVNAQEAGLIPHGEVVLVVTDNAGAYVLTRAARYNIECAVVDKKEFKERRVREEIILSIMREKDIEFIVFAGFMTILSADFVSAYEGRIINVHPALIPSFCGPGYYGLKVHEEVLARGVKVTGATVHYVTEVCDGGPILLQKAVEVKEGDTPEVLQKRVMREAEWVILPEAVELVCKKLQGIEG
ncbi:MAG TPA: phosphoribosylglycinamide formyltransferase [Candidatus Gallimonas intestinigallinarum]|uniref:Phosphoribosylglycinamide formyltransferase n=1 Tax=Candidatus Gallimonas intestinigallinarum TaxID=2838604 RepID=A0A9D2IVL9_9FIRM|nr:phosphoribosylglycinamide formyltransferase [Candidatus Gallimonas intestinigallinarum]